MSRYEEKKRTTNKKVHASTILQASSSSTHIYSVEVEDNTNDVNFTCVTIHNALMNVLTILHDKL